MLTSADFSLTPDDYLIFSRVGIMTQGRYHDADRIDLSMMLGELHKSSEAYHSYDEKQAKLASWGLSYDEMMDLYWGFDDI